MTERKRAGLGLLSFLREAFVNGYSTRKIDRLEYILEIEILSGSQVPEITKEVDMRVDKFRTRQLQPEYPLI
jgi:transposase-like protein